MPEEHERFKHIELEILTACDLACHGCDRFSDVTNAPSMTVDQVRLFVEESLDLKWEWERIRLLGGEPTLHPKLREMAELLVEYRRHFPKCFLQLLSNGRGKLAQHRDWLLERNIDPHVEAKEPDVNPVWFTNTRIVPLDRDPTIGAIPPCGIFGIRGCGIGLTRHGYFLDGAGASIARVAGYDIGVQHLKDVTWEAMMEQSKVLCRVCGHWNPVDGEPVTKRTVDTGPITGKFWTETLERYRQGKPLLTVYGGSSMAVEICAYDDVFGRLVELMEHPNPHSRAWWENYWYWYAEARKLVGIGQLTGDYQDAVARQKLRDTFPQYRRTIWDRFDRLVLQSGWVLSH